MVDVRKVIQKSPFLTKGERLLVAVSGGVDSMVLAHALCAEGHDLALVHVNYGLRGFESDLDEELVREFSKEFKTEIFVNRIALPLQGNLQENARTARYRYFESVRATSGYNLILTAHHADDVLEGFLLHFARGAGLKGLKPMEPVTGHIVRPLLEVWKSELVEYAIANHVSYRDDSSNATQEYDRNFIRHSVIPSLISRFTGFRKSAMHSLRILSDHYSLYMEQYEEWKRNSLIESPDDKSVRIVVDNGFHFVRQFLADLRFHPTVITNITNSLDKPGRMFISRSGANLYTHKDCLVYVTEPLAPLVAVSISCDDALIGIETGYLSLENIHGRDVCGNLPTDLNWAYFDKGKLHLPLHIRSWQAGDKVRPMGMKGHHRKVQDIYSDHKLTIPEKTVQPVLCDHLGEVLWIPGLVRSDRAPVNAESENVICLRWQKK